MVKADSPSAGVLNAGLYPILVRRFIKPIFFVSSSSRRKLDLSGVDFYFKSLAEEDPSYYPFCIRRPVSDLREKRYNARGMRQSFMFRLSNDLEVDATKKDSKAHFINHLCEANMYFKIIHVRNELKIVFLE